MKVEQNSCVYKMQAQLVLLILLFVLTSADEFSTRKCCPSGKNVKLETFSCVALESLRVENQTERTIDEDREKWPACNRDETLFMIVENSFNITGQNDFCVDITEDNQIVKIYCKNDNITELNQKSFPIYPVNKCCPLRMKYDYENRTCVKAMDYSSSTMFLDDSIIFETHHLPICGVKNALVEYHSGIHQIKLNKHLLTINDRLVDGSFCTEETTSGELVAKVCESFDICSRIPCIRKCCNERQFFDTNAENEKSKCQDYEYDLIKIPFYNFSAGDDLLSDQPLRIELSGKLIIESRNAENKRYQEFLLSKKCE